MMSRENLQERQERARLFWLVSLLTVLLIPLPGLAAVLLGPWLQRSGSALFELTVVPFAVAWWLALGSLLLGHFRRKARQEEEDRQLLEQRKRQSSASVFEGEDEYLCRHQRTLEKFLRWGPVLLLFGMIAILGGSLTAYWLAWAGRATSVAPAAMAPGQMAFVALLTAVVTLFGGVFCIGQSREAEFRWLQAVGAWLTLAALIGALSCVVLICRYLELAADGDVLGRSATWGLLALLGVELIGNFVIEFYRPRTLGEARPVFESRLLALFTEPGGVVKNVADTLDYQFGFQASGTWLYRLLERSVIPLVMFWLAALWLLTMVAEVGYGEVGVRERFGRAQLEREPLGPGLYLKLPWPCERIVRHPVGQLREVTIGSQIKVQESATDGRPPAPETRATDGDKKYEVVLWTVSHYEKEVQYLVATERTATAAADPAIIEDVPVSFLAAMLPIQYRISNVIDFAYHHTDAPATLRALAEREVTNYLASADLLTVMSTGRGEATQALTQRLQTVANELRLGVEIVYVNFHDAHPPIEQVAPSFQEVVGAQEEMESKILAAHSYERRVLPAARGEARTQVHLAEAYANQVIKVAEADMERFAKQILVYRTMPEMYLLRSYLDFLENDCQNTRKYIVTESVRDEVFIINLEEKAQLDLLSADLADLREKDK